jgi:hypothetical protein
MAMSTVKTKLSTGTKVAIGVALLAGGLAVANALIPVGNAPKQTPTTPQIPLSPPPTSPPQIPPTSPLTIIVPLEGATLSALSNVDIMTSATATGLIIVATNEAVQPPLAVTITPKNSANKWTAQWDTLKVPNGSYTLQAQANGDAGRRLDSPLLRVLVNNGGTAVPPAAIKGQMKYELAPSDQETDPGLVALGGKNVVLAKFRLTASGEDLTQTKIRFTLANLANSPDVISLSLYDGATLVAGPVASSANGAFDFVGMTIKVPKDTSKTYIAKADLNSNANGARSGDDLQLKLHVPATDDKSLEYAGAPSGGLRSAQAGGDVTGRTKIAVKTMPTVTSASLPTQKLVNGTVIASRFTLNAGSSGTVAFKKATFTVNLSAMGILLASPSLSVVGSGAAGIPAAATIDMSGSSCGFAASPMKACVRVAFTAEQEIPAGASKVYELRLVVSGKTAPTDTISTTLLGDEGFAIGTIGGSGSAIGVGGKQSNFLWSDESALPHGGAASRDWMSGAFIKVLPTDPQLLAR